MIALSLSTCVSMRGTAGDGPGRDDKVAGHPDAGKMSGERAFEVFSATDPFDTAETLGKIPFFESTLIDWVSLQIFREPKFLNCTTFPGFPN